VDGKASLKGAWLSHVNHLNFGGHNHIPGTTDRLKRCQLSSLASVINFWRSAAMLITSTVVICIQHLGRVEEMVFTARRSYASAVLGVVLLSVCPSVRPSVRLSHVCFVTNPKNLPAIFFIPHERAILLVKCDFSYSGAAADKISNDLRRRAIPLRQLSYLFIFDWCSPRFSMSGMLQLKTFLNA